MYEMKTSAPATSPAAPLKRKQFDIRDKGKNFSAQYQICYLAFSEMPKTMAMVERETGIWRSNICRFVATMKRQGLIQLIRKDVCPITGMNNVGFYQTDANIQPVPYVPAPIDAPIQHSCPAPEPSGSALNDIGKAGNYCYQLFY